MRPGKQSERVTRDKRYLEIAVAGCLEIYSCVIEGRGIDRSRWLPQTIDGRPERTSFTIHTGPYTPQYQTSGVSIFHLPKEGGEISHLRIAEAATQPGRFPSDLVRTESNFFLSSSHRATPEPDVCLLSHPRSLSLASAGHRSTMPQPQPAHVYDEISSSCLGGFSEACVFLCRWHDSFQRGRTHFPTAESGLFSMAMASKAGIRGAISGLSSDPPHPQPISRREVSPVPGTLPTSPPLQKQNKSPALPLHKPTQHARHTATCTPSPNHFHHRQVSSHPSHHPPQHQTRRIRIPAQIRGPIRTRLHVATPVPTRRISQTPPCQTPSKHQVTGTSQAKPSQARTHPGR